MSFSVDQFMQVKCKFQLISESDSSESIYSNNERIRLCTSVDLDEKSSIIVMICSNDTGNNHIVAYYIESRTAVNNQLVDSNATNIPNDSIDVSRSAISDRKSSNVNHNVTFTQFAQATSPNSQHSSMNSSICLTQNKNKPKIIVKQIYYHSYNEDIAAINLSDSGNKLALINMSSTIYIIPIKNIMLDLYAKQLRSSQGKSMYFYDASIIDCCSISSPVSLCFWENSSAGSKQARRTIIVGNNRGELSFISIKDKKEFNLTNINEPIRQLKVIRDRFSYSLLITSESFRQYRFILELNKHQELIHDTTPAYQRIYNDEYAQIEKDYLHVRDVKPTSIKMQNPKFIRTTSSSSVLQRVFVPSSRAANQANIISNIHTKERSLQLIFYHSASMLSLVDIIRSSKTNSPSSKTNSTEPRLFRFYATKNYYYRAQKPMFACRLTSLENDEMITHVVITDRFLAIATDRNRCLINSRNCCDMKNPNAAFDLDPLVKEVTFNSEENIQDLFKSPVSNDQDGIIDSFLLVTNRSIYSIEARQNCRDMYVNLIDGHLSIKLESPKDGLIDGSVFGAKNCATQRKSSETNHMINSFLNMREDIYDRIISDSRAFSALYKLALNSLYEAYADRLLLREQYNLANRFYQLAGFSYMKILGKYMRLEWSRLSQAQKVANSEIWSRSQSSDFGSLSNAETLTSKGLMNITLSQLELFRRLVVSSQESQEAAPKTPLGQYKQLIWNIFNEALNVYLDEFAEDACKLWFNYINFYLNYVGDIDELECDILELLGSTASDYRLAITLYKAVERDELSSSAKSAPVSEDTAANSLLESMDKLYNLSHLFKNEFLMRLLERTLDACESSSHSLCISCL